ncbi:MAG: hypothetical protein MUP31_03385, partial [Xanthomonadales bacterium]|nr:hypothetical protein [Xanthomonadales bacterium]
AVTTDETCNVCHSTDRIADIATYHQTDSIAKAVVSITKVSVDGDDTIDVAFHAQTAAGAHSITDLTIADIRVYLADIVPADIATGNTPQTTWDTPYLERYAYERSSTSGAELDVSDAENGNYVFNLVRARTDSAIAGTLAPDGSFALDVQRVLLRVAGDDTNYNDTIGLLDFMMPATGSSTTGLAGLTRVIVDASACTACHSDPLQKAAHGGGYQSPQGCNICHTPIGGQYGDEMQADEAWLASLIHKLHAAIDMPAFDDRINDGGYSNVTFPQPINDCGICHFEADPVQDMADAWYTNPTMEVCGTCHTAVDFATHNGGQTDNSACFTCHNDGSLTIGVRNAHANELVPAAADTPEYAVSITMAAPANGSYYVSGEAPMVTVTLAAADGGDEANYTAPGDEKGDRDGNLAAANLYVYGPRAHFMPVLTAAAAEGSQSNNLLGDADDAQVFTDATGFKYQLSAIPPTMAAGTYIVRFEGGDYGAIADTNYQTHSSAAISFQIGTSTVEAKVAGDCTTCHGDTRMHLSGAHPHNAAFDTDQCSSCHDYSGGYGTALVQRVHAVHSASEAGADGHGRAWEKITFPQDTDSCQACHSSGKTTYKDFSGDRTIACTGCHGDNTGMKDHALQNGGGSF